LACTKQEARLGVGAGAGAEPDDTRRLEMDSVGARYGLGVHGYR